MNKSVRHPLPITVKPYWQDHRFLGRAVLPAVEIMILLTEMVQRADAQLAFDSPAKARFDKFLELPPNGKNIEAFCDLTRHTDGSVDAELITRVKSRTGLFTRTVVHAGVQFGPETGEYQDLPLGLDADLKGQRFAVPAQDVYAELVPFGTTFQTLRGDLQLSRYGVLARMQTPDVPESAPLGPLGSPFALDGAFHAACVWTQRFKQVVAFPVGVTQRIVLKPTQPGQIYHCRVNPISIQNDIFFFDIWIFDRHGRLSEVAQGVAMRDVSQGRLTPPEWITSEAVI